MTTTTAQRTFIHRIGYLVTSVIPADLLNDDPIDKEDTSSLRADASQDGLSYIQITRSLEDGVYLARVAASPDCAARGYTVLLSEQQLYSALPWDHRLSQFLEKKEDQHPQPARILALLRACAAEVRPLVKLPAASKPDTQPQAVSTAAEIAFEAKDVQALEVSAEDLQEALGLSPTDTIKGTSVHITRKSTYRMQQAFLRVAVDTLMIQLYQGQDRAYALTIKAKCALIAWVQRWHRQTRQQVVNATLAFDGQRQRMIWQLTIGVPTVANLAA